ncbi:MAG: hypothetical protein MRJ68_11225 [Nitrospira sp.]|nr:hypothetical protein [Nitrospira sp.]
MTLGNHGLMKAVSLTRTWVACRQVSWLANDTIDKPESHQRDRQPHEEEADPKGRDDKAQAAIGR